MGRWRSSSRRGRRREARMSGVVGVVLAAGAGTRLGGAVPKPAVRVRGPPLLTWPLAALAAGGPEDVVVVPRARAHPGGAGGRVGGRPGGGCEARGGGPRPPPRPRGQAAAPRRA